MTSCVAAFAVIMTTGMNGSDGSAFSDTTDFDPIQLGHHDVEQDQDRGNELRVTASASSPSMAVTMSVAVRGEAAPEDFDIIRIVVGDEDQRRRPHLRSSLARL